MRNGSNSHQSGINDIEQGSGTFFHYRPEEWMYRAQGRSEGCIVAVAIWFLVFSLIFIVVGFTAKLPANLVMIGVGVILVPLYVWLMFSNNLLAADLELTQEQVVLHFTRNWKLHINLQDLYPVQIREHAVRRRLIFTWSEPIYVIYVISSPNLPWYFRFAEYFGYPTWITKPSFYVTSWHENYREFLNKMRAYEPQWVA
ncbi:MAG: hypothetical protein JXB30_03170 [Anaerolineae bacterium]|nr:hypothetical protein [Anaerolineae bacterium]